MPKVARTRWARRSAQIAIIGSVHHDVHIGTPGDALQVPAPTGPKSVPIIRHRTGFRTGSNLHSTQPTCLDLLRRCSPGLTT